MSEKIRRVRHFILDLRKKIRIPAANFFYPREIYSNKRDRISRIPPSSLPHPLDEKLSHRDPVCYRSSTPLLEFLDNPVYRSGRSARHSKTISRVDLRLPSAYAMRARVGGRRGKKRGRQGEGEVEGRRGERKRSTTVSQIETYSSRFAVSLLSSNSNFSLFFSCFSALDVVGPRWSWNRRRERTSSTTRREVDSPISPLSTVHEA